MSNAFYKGQQQTDKQYCRSHVAVAKQYCVAEFALFRPPHAITQCAFFSESDGVVCQSQGHSASQHAFFAPNLFPATIGEANQGIRPPSLT